MEHSTQADSPRATRLAAALGLYHVLLLGWTFLGAFLLPRVLLPLWIAQIGLTFAGWLAFKGKCWLTRAELEAAPDGQRYQSATLRTIARLGVDVPRHKAALTLAIDTWHYVCVVVAFARLGQAAYAVLFLGVWFVLNRGYRNVWNY